MKRIKKIERKYVSAIGSLRKLSSKQLKSFKTKSSNLRYHIKEEIKRRKK